MREGEDEMSEQRDGTELHGGRPIDQAIILWSARHVCRSDREAVRCDAPAGTGASVSSYPDSAVAKPNGCFGGNVWWGQDVLAGTWWGRHGACDGTYGDGSVA